jgi:secondary thiamine-phosphate synthase enzyme
MVELGAECGHENVTETVRDVVAESGVTTGQATVGMAGSTGGVTTIEYESGALKDLWRAVEQLAPADGEYAHNLKWGDGNGFSHVRSALLKTGLSVPVINGELYLGTWQQITVFNFDNRSRRREIAVVVVGE